MATVSKSSVLGAAGEHYVMCQLLRRGMIAALAPAGVPHTDILVTDAIGDRACAIQVKARREKGGDGGWHMAQKHETIESNGLFYAFVDFGKDLDATPSCFVLPSATVADVIRRHHLAWMASPGKNGQPHNDGKLRRFLPDYERKGQHIGCGPGWLEPYRNAWHLLGG